MKKILVVLTTILILIETFSTAWAVTEIKLYFPPPWKDKTAAAHKIAEGLSSETGIKITPRIADCYPEILTAVTEKKPVLAYVGSMVQTIVWSRKLGTPLFQALAYNLKYGGVMVVPKSASPAKILQEHPTEITYTVGVTSGEVCAKAATNGLASVAVTDQLAALDAVKNGKAKAAFVKNTWFEENKVNYPDFLAYSLEGISDYENADNLMLISKFVAPEIKSLIMSAAIKQPHIFDAPFVAPFDSSLLSFTLDLMHKAGIDPLTYTWKPVHSGGCHNASVVKPPEKQQSESPTQQSLSAGEQLMEKKCGDCHLGEKIKQYRRKTKEQWEKSIRSMGVKMTKKEWKVLMNYLLSLRDE